MPLPARSAKRRGSAVTLDGLVDVHDAIFRDGDGTLRAHYVLAVFRGHSADGEPMAATDVHDARFVAISDIDGYQDDAGRAGNHSPRVCAEPGDGEGLRPDLFPVCIGMPLWDWKIRRSMIRRAASHHSHNIYYGI